MAKPQFCVMSHLYEPWDHIKTATAVTCWRHRLFEGRLCIFPFSVNPSDKRTRQKMVMPIARALRPPVLISLVQATYTALPSFHVLLGCVDAENSAASGWFVLSVLENAQLCLCCPVTAPAQEGHRSLGKRWLVALHCGESCSPRALCQT